MNDRTLTPPLDHPERARFVRRSPAFTVITRDGRERSVRPIDALMLHRIMDRRPNLYQRFAANDRYAPQPDPALGGRFGVAVMVVVAALIGVLLATGGVL